jgi:hypothetical protein
MSFTVSSGEENSSPPKARGERQQLVIGPEIFPLNAPDVFGMLLRIRLPGGPGRTTDLGDAMGKDAADSGLCEPLDCRIGMRRAIHDVGPVKHRGDAGIECSRRSQDIADINVLGPIKRPEGREHDLVIVALRNVGAQRSLPSVAVRVDETGHDDQLGRLLCDIVPATVHQRHREPASWRWASDGPPIAIRTTEPDEKLSGAVALKLGFSATVTDSRLQAVLGADAAIWSLCADQPHNDILRRADDQTAFRRELRRLYDRIKARHGEGALLHVFPALPASLAVEVGRAWMPKSDLPLRLYDNNRSHGFIPTFDIP